MQSQTGIAVGGFGAAILYLWALVIFLLPFVGVLAYFFVGRKGRTVA